MQIEFKKTGLTYLPYLYFIGLAAFWFFGEMFGRNNFSYLAMAIMVILITQTFLQNKVFGVILGILVMVLSVLAFLAVLSEFKDFQTLNRSAIELITVGSILSLSGLAMGILLIKTHAAKLIS